MRTKNFYLIGNAAERDIRLARTPLEQFREAFRLRFPQVRLVGGVRTNVVVFKDAASYEPFRMRKDDGTAHAHVAGYFLAGGDVNYITLSVGERRGSLDTIFHEYVHYLLDTNIGRSDLPPWLGEGLAEYFETLQFTEDRRVVAGAPPPGHLVLLDRAGLSRYQDFLLLITRRSIRAATNRGSLFYAQAWALTHYLFHAGKTERPQFDELLILLRGQDSGEAVFEKLFGRDRSATEKALREYITQPLPPARAVLVQGKVSAESGAVAASLPAEQAEAYLGDLLFRLGDLENGENYLRKALTRDTGLASANLSLGLLLAKRQRFAEARPFLEKAVASDSSRHLAHFYYAYALSRESMDDNGRVSRYPAEAEARIRSSLRRAIELNPGFPESYRLLAMIELVSDGDVDEALRLLERGLGIRPGDQNMSLLLAQALLTGRRNTRKREGSRKGLSREPWSRRPGMKPGAY